MALIRPRLNDYHGLLFTQHEVDFAIPFLDEDIPLYVDPFLLWKSPLQQDNGLHQEVVRSFNKLGQLYVSGEEDKARKILVSLSECNEIGLGNSGTRKGRPIGEKTAEEILKLYRDVPQINKQGLQHFEIIQLFVENISRDRISDFTASILKSHLIDATIQHSRKYKIPLQRITLSVFDTKKIDNVNEEVFVPINPETGEPILLIPKRWLKHIPFINYDDYFETYLIKNIEKEFSNRLNRPEIIEFNRNNYGMIEAYLANKLRLAASCENDPLFSQIPISSAKKRVKHILGLPTGKTDNADREYEDGMTQTMATLLYPHLDFAQEQSRTDSGVQIRDLIFYNNRSYDFLDEILNKFDSRQLVVELKNVKSIEREHINQLNRYLKDQFGKFGIIFTRNRPSRAIYQNTIDLWSGQRTCILIMDDTDLSMMSDVYESKQRHPIDIIKKKFIEFQRACPG